MTTSCIATTFHHSIEVQWDIITFFTVGSSTMQIMTLMIIKLNDIKFTIFIPRMFCMYKPTLWCFIICVIVWTAKQRCASLCVHGLIREHFQSRCKKAQLLGRHRNSPEHRCDTNNPVPVLKASLFSHHTDNLILRSC